MPRDCHICASKLDINRTYAENTKNKGCGEGKGKGETGKINPLTLAL
jgi:hypothetical protein